MLASPAPSEHWDHSPPEQLQCVLEPSPGFPQRKYREIKLRLLEFPKSSMVLEAGLAQGEAVRGGWVSTDHPSLQSFLSSCSKVEAGEAAWLLLPSISRGTE